MPKKTIPDDFSIFPKRLKQLMRERKVIKNGREQRTSQQELADSLTVKRQTVSLYLTGQSVPDAIQTRSIAQFFNVSTDWLLGLSDYRTILERQKASNFAASLTTSLARLDDGTRKLAVESLANIAHGFTALCYTRGDTLRMYSDVVFAIGHILRATSSCLAVTAQIDDTAPLLDASDVGENALAVFQNASAAAYTEIGSYIAKATDFVRSSLDVKVSTEIDYAFCVEADKMLKEFRDAHSEWWKQELESYGKD